MDENTNKELNIKFIEPISNYKNLWLSPRGLILKMSSSNYILKFVLQKNYRVYDLKTRQIYYGYNDDNFPTSVIQDITNGRFYLNERYLIDGSPELVMAFCRTTKNFPSCPQDLSSFDEVLSTRKFHCQDLTIFTEKALIERLYSEFQNFELEETFNNYASSIARGTL